MMENKGYLEILDRLKLLIGENKSLQARLEEYKQITDARDTEITILQQMLTDANAMRSEVDDKLQQLKELQEYIGEIKQVEEKAGYQYAGPEGSTAFTDVSEQAMEEMKELNTWQKMQLAELKLQIQEINNRNILLEQKASRIAELESLLANAIADRDEWRKLAVEHK